MSKGKWCYLGGGDSSKFASSGYRSSTVIYGQIPVLSSFKSYWLHSFTILLTVSPCDIGKPEGPCQLDIQQVVSKASVNEQSTPCISFLQEVLNHCSYRNMSHLYSGKNCEQMCGKLLYFLSVLKDILVKTTSSPCSRRWSGYREQVGRPRESENTLMVLSNYKFCCTTPTIASLPRKTLSLARFSLSAQG